MLIRSLGGLAAILGVAGTLTAQPAASLARPRVPAAQMRPINAAHRAEVHSAAPSGGTQPRFGGSPVVQAGMVDAAPPVAPAAPAAPAAPPQEAPAYVCDTGCGPEPLDCSACDCLCGPPGRVWLSGEWLYWATSGNPLPALVTTAPPGTAQTVAGTQGAPGTVTLFGDRRRNNEFRNGLRVTGGMWLDPGQIIGIDASFLYIQPSRQGFAGGSTGTQILTRPFTNVLSGAADTQLVSFPGIVGGTLTADSRSRVIGGGGNFIRNLACSPVGRLDLLLGYRYLNLRDEVTIQENLLSLPGSGVPDGTRFVINDRFRTENQFHGPAVGFAWERRAGHWFIGARASVAMGVSHQVVTIDGSTVITQPGGAPATFAGGLLAQPTNIGRYSSNRFAVMPEVGVRVGLQVTDRVRAFVGYDFIYLSSVARAGDQIDLQVNPNQLPPSRPLNGPASPAFRSNRTDYWMQGISVGAEFRF